LDVTRVARRGPDHDVRLPPVRGRRDRPLSSDSIAQGPSSDARGNRDRDPQDVTAAANHCSSRLRRPLDGRSSIPNRNSPRMIGSTAITRSWRRSQLMTFGSGRGLVGSLRTFASTRNFTAAHTSLVDSDATPTKKPFSGHESSQSASP